jgi:hypothetical protein
MLQFVTSFCQWGSDPGLSVSADPAVFGQSPACFTEAPGNHVKDGAVESCRDILFQRSHADTLLPPDIATVRNHFAAQELQQGRLAHTVAAYQTHALAYFDLEGYIFQQGGLNKSPAYIPHTNQSHQSTSLNG